MNQADPFQNQINEATPPSLPITPSIQKPKSLLLPIILTALITTLVLVGSYFGYQEFIQSTISAKPTPSPIPTASPQSIYGQWTTYQNSSCNYSVKIPADWYAEEIKNEDAENTTYLKSDNFNGSLINPDTQNYQGSIIIITCFPSTDSNDQIQKNCISLNKKSDDGVCNSTNFGQIKLIYTEKNLHQGIENGISYSIKTPDFSEITQRILSTFKFSQADTSTEETQMGFITSIDKNGAQYSMNIDYADMLNGNEAKQQMITDKVCTTLETCDLPNGYYIANVSPKIRTFSISPSVTIDVSTSHQSINLENVMDKKTISFDQLRTLINAEEYQVPWWITISDGVITHISEQYLP